MLIVHEQARERFQAAKVEARRVGLVAQFARQLNHLRTYAEHRDYPLRDQYRVKPKTRVTLYTDFAPHSFSVIWEHLGSDGEWHCWMNGCLIYHGPHDNGGAPTFSVSLTKHHGWSVHT